MVDGETAAAAARKWLWRLTAAERAATERIVVAAPPPKFRPFDVYAGPVVEFIRANGRLEQVA